MNKLLLFLAVGFTTLAFSQTKSEAISFLNLYLLEDNYAETIKGELKNSFGNMFLFNEEAKFNTQDKRIVKWSVGFSESNIIQGKIFVINNKRMSVLFSFVEDVKIREIESSNISDIPYSETRDTKSFSIRIGRDLNKDEITNLIEAFSVIFSNTKFLEIIN